MTQRVLSLIHKKEFDRFVSRSPHSLAAYAFVNQFIWNSCFDIRWAAIKNAFCLFFRDEIGCFMSLPPLGKIDEATLEICFDHMEAVNHNKDISRVENIEEGEIGFFTRLGYSIYEKARDYVVRRGDIATLRGERYKHRRSLYNHCVKHHAVVLRDYQDSDRRAVSALWRRWEAGRRAKYGDPIYRQMLKDSGLAFEVLLRDIRRLGVRAKVVAVNGSVVAFTSGAPVCEDIFSVNFEIADPAYKGLNQFVFTEFAKTLSCDEINMMDDSGIPSLGAAKMLLRPSRLAASYTAVKKD